MNHAIRLSTGLLLAVASASCWGFLSDDGEPMYVEADSVDIDDAKGEALYQGSVEVKQGGMFISGDRMTTYQNDKSEVNKVVTTGNPATLVQKGGKNKNAMDAKASRIEMFLDRDLVYFIGNGSIKQSNTEFYGERIEYNLKTQAIHADKGSSAGKRVRMILQPKKKKKAAQ